MQSAPLVHGKGIAIPAIGLGTFRAEGEVCAQAVQCALEAGYRHIDTASMYGNEQFVGDGLRASSVRRKDLFVTTKIWWTDIAGDRLEAAAEESLKRLSLDHVDLLLIHWPNPQIPLRSSIDALCRVKRAGLAGSIGVSNFTVAMLDEAVALASEPLSMLQAEYHPRLDQSKLRAAAARHGMLWTSYCPIGKGNLFDDPVVTGLASKYGRTPSQIVLRWQMQQPDTVAIPKSVTPSRIRENIAVFDFALTDAETAALSALKRPDGRIVSPAFAPAWDA
jgi:diketogulonate reductase-like aldo/keto reductase